MATLPIVSSLRESQLTPRTPRTAGGRYPIPAFPGSSSTITEEDEEEDAELLKEEEQLFASQGFDDDTQEKDDGSKGKISQKDKRGIALLIVLYLIQGIPMGLTLGSIPFLLKEKLSYSQLGTFALSGYPFSTKLLWSPIVDSIYFPSIGRRRSWIIPMQFLLGSLMFYISFMVDKFLGDPAKHLTHLTMVFTALVMVSATQDIAVDGWALTLLSKERLSYASTCQTIGLNSGFLISFTLFLAFNSEAFASKWGLPPLDLGTYLKFWGSVSYSVLLWIILFQREDKANMDEVSMVDVKSVYRTIWSICKLHHIQMIILVHTLGKIAYAANEAATSLKMIDKGFKREELAIAVLIDFPCQIVGGWLAAKWARGDKPLRPWLWAFWPRLGFCLLGTFLVYFFPKPPITFGFFTLLVLHTVLSSFTQTVQLVGMAAFHTRVSDPLIGGTYMTLMNTFTQLGNIWPKWFVLKGIDVFSRATCHTPVDMDPPGFDAYNCVSEQGKSACQAAGGVCVYHRDGYYSVSAICMILGVILFLTFIMPTAKKLQALPISAWRVSL